MKIKLLALIVLQSFTPLSFAYETGPEIFGKDNDMALCGATRREEYIKIKQTKLDGKLPNIKRFTITEDWRTQGLDSEEFPLSEPLIIEKCKGSCGCTVPEWPKEPIPPGGTGSIKVNYDEKRVGPYTKSITITSNAKTSPKVIKIKGKVQKVEDNISPEKKDNSQFVPKAQ